VSKDYTEAKEWVSLFAHEIVFSQPMKGRQDPKSRFGGKLG
jgi:hypothetical protein